MLPCPRRQEGFSYGDPANDKWHEIDKDCTYCGSMNPDEFLERIRQGTIELGPTDKSYKVYVRNVGGEKFKHTSGKNVDEKVVVDGKEFSRKEIEWTTTESDDNKFYFVHLSQEQKKEFVELYNRSVTEQNPSLMKIGYPGHFCRFPYFMAPASTGLS
jgi:hypothetical protein